jgi:nitrite reductase/ring-hydroxylating ferredoxin subunit
MAKVRIGPAGAVGQGMMAEAVVSGIPYAICNVGGDLHAIDGVCPHRGGPLAQGALHDYTVVCPWHAWEFDCRTGFNDYDPTCRVKTHPVAIQDGSIYIDLA